MAAIEFAWFTPLKDWRRMYSRRNDTVHGWLCALASLFIGVFLLIDPTRFVSSTAWHTINGITPGGRLSIGWFILVCGFCMVAALIYNRFIWATFIAASLWFCYITVGLVRSAFTTTTGGTPGFVVWGLAAALLMNYGVGHLPARRR